MTSNVATAQVAEVGEWATPNPSIDGSKDKQDEEVADNNHINKSKSTFTTREMPIVVKGKRVSFYYNDMVPNCAYRALVAGKPHMFIKDEMGAIDIYVIK